MSRSGFIDEWGPGPKGFKPCLFNLGSRFLHRKLSHNAATLLVLPVPVYRRVRAVESQCAQAVIHEFTGSHRNSTALGCGYHTVLSAQFSFATKLCLDQDHRDFLPGALQYRYG
ncbi:MAG: hypothetical protein CM1200mP41_36510 [Gammaproteobacteria bacterium]|nr:MAG: hypothetical protein CM1200mP41_36510 [Gammaproteobacteria bacterium]